MMRALLVLALLLAKPANAVNQATIYVTGPVTDSQMRASPVPVSGAFYPATQPVSGSVAVSNLPGSQAITAVSLPLPSGASQEHTAAASPNSCRLSDGSSFITTLPVSIASMPSTPVTGPVTDAQLRASAVPVSVAALPLPASASTSAKQDTGNTSVASIDTKTPSLGQAGMAASSPVVIASNQSTVPVSLASAPSTPVTGTFWQATQPVSGSFFQATQPVSIASMPSTPVTGTFWQATQPVSIASMPSTPVTGTFWQATQPISHANLDVALSTRLKPADTLAGVTTVTTVSAVTAITNALPAGTARLGSFRPVDSADADLTAAKGSQTSRGVGVQELKDSGRTQLRFYFNAVAAGATGVETAVTMTKSSGTGATANAASFVITSGKTMRISSVMFGSRGHLTATAQISNCRIRVNTAGAVITSSTPVIYDLATATPATALAWDRSQVTLSEGDEIAGNGTIQFGVTCAAVFTTNAPTWYGLITAYEY